MTTRVKEEKRKLVNYIYQTWRFDCSHACGHDVMRKGNNIFYQLPTFRRVGATAGSAVHW